MLIVQAVFFLERGQTDRQTDEQTDATERCTHAGSVQSVSLIWQKAARRLVTPREYICTPCVGRHIRQRRQANSAACTHAYSRCSGPVLIPLKSVPSRQTIWTPPKII